MVTVSIGSRDDLHRDSVSSLLKKGIYAPTSEKVSRLLSEIGSENGHFYVAFKDRRPIGILAGIEKQANQFGIMVIIVESESRRSGIGRLLVNELVATMGNPVIEAETDDESVGFYHSLGFRISSIGEKYPGTVRYLCTFDHSNWKPRPYDEIVQRIKQAGLECWVSGGWAIDLFLGRQTRIHKDTDISILRKDQRELRKVFGGWEIYHTHAPGLRYWKDGEYLERIPNVWLRKDRESAWAFEVMFQESKDDLWLYRRNAAIQRPIDDIGLVNDEGIPYLRPEVQLLFKGGGSSYRGTDLDDLGSVLPLLPDEARDWLIASLRIEFPSGHDWIEILSQQRHKSHP